MKRIVTIALITLCSYGLYAQENEIQTLFSDSPRISGFGSTFMDFSIIDGQFAHSMGGGICVLLGDLFLGGYGEGLTNEIKPAGFVDRLSYGHGGFWTGYSFLSKKAFHPTVSAQIGWGNISDRDDTGDDAPDHIFVFTPTAELEMNFTRFFRLGIGVHYRFVTGVDYQPDPSGPPLSNADFSGPGAQLIFKFGWF